MRRPVVIIRTGTLPLTVVVAPPGQCATRLRRAMVWSDVPSTSPDASSASRLLRLPLLCNLSAPECRVQKGTIQDAEVRCYLILTRLEWGPSTT
jgi:hypothetical protein